MKTEKRQFGISTEESEKGMKTNSRFFNKIDDIDSKFTLLNDHYRPKREMLKKMVRLHNGLSQAGDGVSDRLKRKEITNYRTSWAELNNHMLAYQAMFNQTARFAQCSIEKDNPIEDVRVAQIIIKALNKHYFHYGQNFANFIDRIGGEELATGVVVSMREAGDALPSIERNMLFPREANTDTGDIPYWFRPIKLSVKDLIDFESDKSGDEKDGTYINTTEIRRLLNELKEVIEKDLQDRSQEYEVGKEWECLTQTEEISATWYYETQDDGSINKTLLVNAKDSCKPTEIVYKERVAERLEDILRVYSITSLIGEDVTFDNAIGVMELIYNPTAEKNEIMNATLDAVMFDLRHKFLADETYDEDENNAVDFNRDSIFKNGLTPMNDTKNLNGALASIQMLDRGEAEMTNANTSNTGRYGELSSQAKIRASIQTDVKNAMNAKRYRMLDSEVSSIAYSLLSRPPEKLEKGEARSFDYDARFAIHKMLKEHGVTIKEYLKKAGGRLEFISFKCDRILSPADKQSLESQNEYLQATMGSRSPEARQVINYRMDASFLGAELADDLNGNDGILEKLRTDQQFMADSEIMWIKDKSIIEASHPIGINDNHHIHIETILTAMKVMIARAIAEPWNLNNVKEFSGLTDHGIQHVNAINQAGFTEESQASLVEIQGLVNQGRELSAEVDRQQQGVVKILMTRSRCVTCK